MLLPAISMKQKHLKTPLIAAAIWLLGLPLAQADTPLTIENTFGYFNVYVINNITWYEGSDFQGTTGVGGYVKAKNFTTFNMEGNEFTWHIGDYAELLAGTDLGAIEIGGNLTIKNRTTGATSPVIDGTVYSGGDVGDWGNAHIFGDVYAAGSTSGLTAGTIIGGNAYPGTPYTPVVDLNAVSNYFLNYSTLVAAKPNTGTVTDDGWGHLEIHAESGENVYSIQSWELGDSASNNGSKPSKNIHTFKVFGPQDAVVYINVEGSGGTTHGSITWSYEGNGTPGKILPRNVLLNYNPAITSITMKSTNIVNILAPNATINFTYGRVNGNLIAGNLNGSVKGGQVNLGHFNPLVASVDHFLIDHDGSGSICQGENIGVIPKNSDGSDFPDFAETIVLDTQNGKGNWVTTNGNGTLTDATPDDGLATYTFSGTETYPVEFSLEYTENGDTFNIDVYSQDNTEIRDDDSEGDITFSDQDCDPYFVIGHDGHGVFCVSEAIEVTPMKYDGSDYVGYNKTIILDAQTGNGTWTTTGNGILTDDLDDGIAEYLFSGTETLPVTFSFTYSEGDPSVNIDVYEKNNPSARDDDSEGILYFETGGFALTPNAFPDSLPAAIDPVPTQTAGVPFNLYITAIEGCQILTDYTGDKTVNLWTTYSNPTTPKTSVTIDGTEISQTSTPPTEKSLNFTSGRATVTTKYKDTGKISINVQDKNMPNFSGETNKFVVKPYDLVLEVTDCNDNSLELADGDPQNQTCPARVQAGVNFCAQLTAVDADGDTTPNFGQADEQVALPLGLIAPTGEGVNAPDISYSNGFAFTNGVGTGDDFSWAEVGIISLTPTVSNFLGAGTVTARNSTLVGRFIPYNLAVAQQVPELATANDTFTYLGQPFGYTSGKEPVLVVTAINKNNVTTSNYRDDFFRFGTSDIDHAYTEVNSRTITVSESFGLEKGNGTGTITFNDILTMERDTPTPAYDAVISLSVSITEADGVLIRDVDQANTSFNNINFSNGNNMRFGWLTIGDRSGPENTSLDVPVKIMYRDASGSDAVNEDDNSSSIKFSSTDADIDSADTLTWGDGTGAGQTCILEKPAANPGNSGIGCKEDIASPESRAYSGPTANAGIFTVWLKAPNAIGRLMVKTDESGDPLPSWLRSEEAAPTDWDDFPVGIVEFGSYNGNSKHIYLREVY